MRLVKTRESVTQTDRQFLGFAWSGLETNGPVLRERCSAGRHVSLCECASADQLPKKSGTQKPGIVFPIFLVGHSFVGRRP
jgi:hypothetical protein